jgi:hypothetical protein
MEIELEALQKKKKKNWLQNIQNNFLNKNLLQ